MHTAYDMRRTRSNPVRSRCLAVARRAALAGVALVTLFSSTGCGRTLMIRQDKYINTAPQANRPAAQQTGEPLELAIVCVYPADLDKDCNKLLAPDSKITAKDWYERRPQIGSSDASRFDLPSKQVFVMTDDKNVYGTRIGSKLRGADHDGDVVKKTGIHFDGGVGGGRFFDSKSVIYVFPKFIGKDGGVLPVPPAKFHPPGAYTEQLEIKIGVEPNTPLESAQYIKVLSERKLQKSGE
jgi:hypothetical protein